MIARVWKGEVPKSKAAEYLRLMQEVALPDYRGVAGNQGAWCLTREVGDCVEFTMLTFWTDIEAIKRFAGADYERAKYYDFDPGFLVEMTPGVQHYEAYADGAAR